MSMINAFEAGDARLSASDRALVERRARLLGPAYRLFYEHPVHVVRGEGVWLFGPDGQRYLDAYNNVPCVGHCHPQRGCAREEAGILNVHTRYLQEHILDYAQALLATLPAELGHVLFTCTGSEANDLAYRIATRHTGGTGFIVTELAYHGCTQAIAELSPSLGTQVAPGAHGAGGCPRRVSQRCEGLGGAVRSRRASGHRGHAAGGHQAGSAARRHDFSSDGIYADPPGFLRQAIQEVHDAGALFIADEVQAGFSRTGDSMWGFERHGVRPDIVTMGKPMGAGHPMGGVAVRPEVVAEFGQGRYFNTFGWESGLRPWSVWRCWRSSSARHCRKMRGSWRLSRTGLQSLGSRHALVGDVLARALFIGVELVSDRTTRRRHRARQRPSSMACANAVC